MTVMVGDAWEDSMIQKWMMKQYYGRVWGSANEQPYTTSNKLGGLFTSSEKSSTAGIIRKQCRAAKGVVVQVAVK